MNNTLKRMWSEDDGVLSFEWVLLITLLAIGIVGGLAAGRDAILDELGDIAELTLTFDQSYTFAGLPALGIPASEYEDTPGEFEDCDRNSVFGQDPRDDFEF